MLCDLKLRELEAKIRKGIHIPKSLEKNMLLTTTLLGGVFIEYYCDCSSKFNQVRSNHMLSLSLVTGDKFDRYDGDICGLEAQLSRNVPMPENISVRAEYAKVVAKINNWICNHEKELVSYIVH